jgi:hypothetical protein
MPKKVNGTIAAPGRVFFVIGPLCWGRGETEAEAVRNAKANFSPMMGGKWRYIVFDAHESVTIDGMGSFCYYPEKIPAGQQPYTELKRVGFVVH